MSQKVIGINQIKEIVPFRPPYLMVDRAIISEDGTQISGVKAVAGNEVFFCGHFPEQAIMPGVLQVEAMTQLGLIAANHKAKYAFVREVSRVKFRNPVVPGDVLELEATITESNDERISLKAKASVAGQLSSQATIVIDLIDEDAYFQPSELYPTPKYEQGADIPFDVEGIKATIPHRFPFQLVDRVIYSGETEDGLIEIVGIKNVTFNEPYFQSIKNEQPFLPNYLLMEIAAQLGCIRKLSDPELSNMLGLYLGVDKALFHKPVLPGDSLYLHVIEDSFKMGFGKCSTKIYVGDDLVSEVVFKYALAEKKA